MTRQTPATRRAPVHLGTQRCRLTRREWREHRRSCRDCPPDRVDLDELGQVALWAILVFALLLLMVVAA